MSTLLITAVVHLDIDDWALMENALATARQHRPLPANDVFHLCGSRPAIRAAFFDEVRRLPCCAHARICDKRLWVPTYIHSTRGDARIQAEIVGLLVQCPDQLIAGQTLLIDGEKPEAKEMASVKTELNRRLALAGRAGIRRVRACPDDHAAQGAIVQVADMIAGALHDAGRVTGPYLTIFEAKITLV